METSEKIKLYGSRDFSGNFDMSIKFIKQNFAPVARGLSYLIPLLLIVAFFMPNLFKVYYHIGSRTGDPSMFMDDMFIPGFFIAYILLIIIMFTMMLYSICYMALYVKSENGGVNSSDVWKKVSKVALPAFGSSILFSIIFLIGYVLCLIPGIVIAVYFGFYLYVYINEDLSIIDSFRRSYTLVQNNFWVTLGYSLAFSLLIGMASFVFIVPFYVGMIASMFQVEFFSNDIVFIIMVSILFIGYIFLYSAFYMAMGVMYYSHRNKLEGIDMESEIDNIGKQNDTPPSIPY